jgi:hypothetical protein
MENVAKIITIEKKKRFSDFWKRFLFHLKQICVCNIPINNIINKCIKHTKYSFTLFFGINE